MTYNIYVIGDFEEITQFFNAIEAQQTEYDYIYYLDYDISAFAFQLRFIHFIPELSKYSIEYILYTYHPHLTLQITRQSNYYRYLKEIQSLTNVKSNIFVPMLMLIIDNKSTRIESNYFFEYLHTFSSFFEVEEFRYYVYGPLNLQLFSNQIEVLNYEIDLTLTYIHGLSNLQTSTFYIPIPRFRLFKTFPSVPENLTYQEALLSDTMNKAKMTFYSDRNISRILEFEKSDFINYEIFKKAKSLGCQNYLEWIEKHTSNWELLVQFSTIEHLTNDSSGQKPISEELIRIAPKKKPTTNVDQKNTPVKNADTQTTPSKEYDPINLEKITLNILVLGEREIVNLVINKIGAKQTTDSLFEKEFEINNYSILFTLFYNLEQFSYKEAGNHFLDTFKPRAILYITDESNKFTSLHRLRNYSFNFNVKTPLFITLIDNNQSNKESNYFFELVNNFYSELLYRISHFIYGPFYLDLFKNDPELLDYSFLLLFTYITALNFSFIGYSIPTLHSNELIVKLNSHMQQNTLSIQEVKKIIYKETDIETIDEFEKSDFPDFEIFKKARKKHFQDYRNWIECEHKLEEV